ncbi:CheX protein [Halalkalibacter wakoensis JCM 9140]|uniref:CheX protein n=1 Tax=Halalkalibacter wakoensis JCM 9140 TaxID=1236970 RepID=W4Q373_9BACI|nr:chemotaxis protein CheX [Halalkalibacter wakoensis]GAE26521.1 CheX protein [Halalkalibacter wakoensis JCM 9140]
MINLETKDLIQGVVTSMKSVVPISLNYSSPLMLQETITVDSGVVISLTGEMTGKLLISGETSVFASIGHSMFGMPLEGEMLQSFIGELGNMVAGSFSTIIVEYGLMTDITAPTVLQEVFRFAAYQKAMSIPISFPDVGEMTIYLLLEN